MGVFDNAYSRVPYYDLGHAIADRVRYFNSPDWMTDALKARSAKRTDFVTGKQTTAGTAPGSVDALIKRFQDRSAGDAFALQWKMNPIGTTTSLIGSGLDVANSIWSSFQNYRADKQAMDLANKDYELKKQMYEANEARNQEKFDWLKQSRATSQL